MNETKYQTAGKYNGTTYEFKHKVQIRDYYGSLVYVVNDHGLPDQRTVLYVHGGAWFQDPLENHFEYLDLLVDALDARVIMPVYPKIPHRDYRTTFELLTKIYKRLLTKIDEPENLVIIGDSAGGQIALAFAQMLKKSNSVNLAILFLFHRCLMRHLRIQKQENMKKKIQCLELMAVNIL